MKVKIWRLVFHLAFTEVQKGVWAFVMKQWLIFFIIIILIL